MPADIPCRCCGVPLDGTPRAELRRCILCDLCDRRHGAELQHVIARLVTTGQITLWHAIARMAIDDAHLSGMLELRVNPDRPTLATIWLPAPVPRWRVMIGRAAARTELPDLGDVVQAVLARHLPGAATRARLDEIEQDLVTALRYLDPAIISVQAESTVDRLDPQHLVLTVTAKTPADGVVAERYTPQPPHANAVAFDHPDAPELPADILFRPRGQA